MTDDGAGALVGVRIIGLPLSIVAEAEEHVEGLLREFALIAASHASGGEAHVPGQLLDLVSELEGDYAEMTVRQQAQLAEARQDGLDSIDLVYDVPPSLADACIRLGDALDAADRFCREGRHLLSLATPPKPLAFRRWYLDEFVRQIEGKPPTPWPAWVADHPEAGVAAD